MMLIAPSLSNGPPSSLMVGLAVRHVQDQVGIEECPRGKRDLVSACRLFLRNQDNLDARSRKREFSSVFSVRPCHGAGPFLECEGPPDAGKPERPAPVCATRFPAPTTEVHGAMPSRFIEPCLPSPADRPPSGFTRSKHDGYRLMARAMSRYRAPHDAQLPSKVVPSLVRYWIARYAARTLDSQLV
jgi:hypothetical protein